MRIFKGLFRSNIKTLAMHQDVQKLTILLKQIGKVMSSSIFNLDKTLKIIVNAASTLTNSRIVLLFLVDPKENKLLLKSASGFNLDEIKTRIEEIVNQDISLFKKDFIKEKIKKTDPKIFRDLITYLNIKSFVNARLVRDQDIYGIIICSAKMDYTKFTRQELEILELLSSFASISIENALIHIKEKKQAENLKILKDMDRILNSTLDYQKVLNTIVYMAVKLFNGTNGSLLIINDKDNYLDIVSSINIDKEFVKKTRFKIGQGITGWVAQTGQSLYINDVRNDKRYYQDSPDIKSEIAVPLKFRNKVIGVINVESNQFDRFTGEDLELLNDFAINASIAFKNAKEFNK
jgi:GAF domain-containing protein